MTIPTSLPSTPPPIIFHGTNGWHRILAESKGFKNKKIVETIHSSKANREKMHLLNMELCCWKPASWFSVLDSPGSLRQRVGKTAMLKSETAFWVRYQDSPVQWNAVAAPGSLLRWKSIWYSMAVGQGTVVYGQRQWVTGSGARGLNTWQQTPEQAPSNPWRGFSFLWGRLSRSLGG